MKTERIDLYKYFNVTRPEGAAGYLTTLIIDDYEFCVGRRRPAMLVLGGGGYAYVSQREMQPVALKYTAEGFNTFVLEYSVSPVRFPTALIESCMAMAYIRENAKELLVDENHVAAVGFSAGGHLLGTLSNMWDCEEVKAVLKDKTSLCRPDASVYSYAVVSSSNIAHAGSFNNLCGYDQDLKAKLSLENKVTKDAPPAFIWTTVNDNAVPSENSLLLAMAYKKADVPFELHLFENGIHGLSVCTMETNYENKEVEKWLPLSITWLKNKGFKI